MVFVVCGLNHKTAPIAIREQFSFSSVAGHEPNSTSPHSQAKWVGLSTCNRSEIYCNTDSPQTLIPWLAEQFKINADVLNPYLYLYQEADAVQHLLRVATGLDSMMLGEAQIFGQLKQAYQQANEMGAVDKNLRQIFQFVFSASKRIRTQSQIGKNPISIASAAVQRIGQHFHHYADLTVFIIGSGDTASLVAKYLKQQGVKRFMIANRTQENASLLANRLLGEAYPITDIPLLLPQADVVISATACPLPFINQYLVERALIERNQQLMLFLDLAMPRDIEANVAELDGVRLYNIDDLQHIVDGGVEERRQAAALAETLIEEEMTRFLSRQQSLKANGIITDYRSMMKQFADDELQRAKQKISLGECHDQVLNEFGERLINKLMHFPTLGLRQVATDQRHDLIDLARYLFTPQNPCSSS